MVNLELLNTKPIWIKSFSVQTNKAGKSKNIPVQFKTTCIYMRNLMPSIILTVKTEPNLMTLLTVINQNTGNYTRRIFYACVSIIMG